MSKDEIVRFLFENHGVRGEIMRTQQAMKDLFAHHTYPPVIENLMMDLSTCANLVAATLKANGEIMMQIMCDKKQDGLKYAMINISRDLSFYGSASYNRERNYDFLSFQQLVGENAVLIITVFPEQGNKYQGIVALDRDNLADCLEHYFDVSEQLATRILLFKNEKLKMTAGMLLQIIPNVKDNTKLLEHLYTLASTLKSEEVFNLSLHECLYRLFWNEKTVVYEPKGISFKCICSKERCKNTLLNLGRHDLEELLKDASTTMTCQHCSKKYTFSKKELQDIYNMVNQ